MELPNTICMLPWISIETSPIGTARPCCMALDEITDANGKKMDLNQTTVEIIYKSAYMQTLRQQFRSGHKPETCKRCWDEEAAGRNSKRLNSKIRLKELLPTIDWQNDSPDQLWFLDLKLGNICNLKCRICGSWSSSKWAAEELEYIDDKQNKKQHLAYQWLRQGAWPRNTKTNFWSNLKELLPQVRYFEFTGGEPWLIQEHFDLLEFAAANGYSKNIDIHYNTNATQPIESHLELFSKFRRVDIAFSVDNVGQRFEYERYGSDWNLANKIIDDTHNAKNTTCKNITTQLCFTVNIQNVYYLDELLTWAATKKFGSIYFNLLHSPNHMSIQYMTADAKKLVLEKLRGTNWNSNLFQREIDNIVNFIENGRGSNGEEFRERMQKADAHRKQNFLDSHYEIAQAMGYE
jgi:MoaA/NifB/PqqE/SkfB family radical SAM enzyme